VRRGSPTALVVFAVACAPRAIRPVDRGVVPVATAAVVPSRLLLADSVARSFEVLPREGGVRRVVLFGRPAEVRGGEVRFGRGRFLREVAFAAPAEGGRWRFFTADGVWDADDFLGAPRRVADGAAAVGRGVGRSVVVSDGVLAGMRPPDRGAVVDAAFSDDALGLAVTDPGLAWITRDGGQHWARVTIEGAARSVVAGHDQRWLRTSHGVVAVDARGEVTAADPAVVPRVELLDPAEGDALARAHPGAFERIGPVAVASEDGAMIVARSGFRWGRYDLRDDSWVPLPALPDGCGSQPQWLLAGRLHARCGPDLHALGDDGRWSLRLHVASCGAGRCVGSTDGARVACEGRCVESDDCIPDSPWCESEEGAPPVAWRPVRSPTPWRVLGYVGHRLLAIERTASSLDALRVTLGDDPPRRLLGEAPSGGLGFNPSTLGLGRDGQVRMVAAVPGAAFQGVLEGPPGGRFRWRPSPGGEAGSGGRPTTSQWLLADHLTAVTQRPDRALLVSRGSGGAWVPLAAAPDDPLAADVIALATRPGPYPMPLPLWTDAGDRTSFGEPLVVGGTGPVRLARTADVGLPRTWSPEPGPDWVCVRSSNEPWTDPWRALRAPPWLGRAGVVRGGRVRLIDPDPATVDPWGFLAGEFATGADLTRLSAPDHRDAWVLATFDATQATLLHVSAGAASGEGAFEVRAIGAAHPPGPTSTFRVPGRCAAGAVAAVARDGSRAAAMVWSSGPYEGDGGGWWIAEVRRDGSMSAAPIAFTPSAPVGPYVLDGAAGFIRVAADGRVVGGPAGASPRVLAERVRNAPCPASARGDVRLLVKVSIEGGEYIGPRDAVARYALDGAVLCLRSIGSEPPGTFAIAPTGEGWGARSVDRRSLIRHQCTAQSQWAATTSVGPSTPGP
jgi:hypothetical protein